MLERVHIVPSSVPDVAAHPSWAGAVVDADPQGGASGLVVHCATLASSRSGVGPSGVRSGEVHVLQAVAVPDERRPPPPHVTVVLPCLDEAGAVGDCVRAARAALDRAGLRGEVVVVDNGSTDGSAEIAAAAGARVVREDLRGYGAALRAGFAAARGDVVVMADADGSYDLAEVPRFVAAVDAGCDLVVGDRRHGMRPGAMPWLHRWVGNPLLSRLLDGLFHTSVPDAHCGLRAFRADVLPRLGLQSTGMELASEMVVRAGKASLAVASLSTTYAPRVGRSKLSSWRDGWRHLRLLLVHAPLPLFVLPGGLLAALGALMALTVLTGVEVLGRQWHAHTLVAGALLLTAGTQWLCCGVVGQAYAVAHLGEDSRWLRGLRSRLGLEHGLLAGGALLLAGAVGCAAVVLRWAGSGFATLSELRLAVVAATLVTVGLQVVACAFLLSVLGVRPPPSTGPGRDRSQGGQDRVRRDAGQETATQS